jgi:hypothetical protein
MPEAFNIVQNSLSYNQDAGVTRGFHAAMGQIYFRCYRQGLRSLHGLTQRPKLWQSCYRRD